MLVKTLPIGIEPSDFHERLNKAEVQEMIQSTRRNFNGLKVLIGIDRLDYIKGIPQKLHALDEFFQHHPDQVGRVVLVQVAIPSRANLDANQKLRVEIQELIGKINGKYGTRKTLLSHGILLHFCTSTNSLDLDTMGFRGCFNQNARIGKSGLRDRAWVSWVPSI